MIESRATDRTPQPQGRMSDAAPPLGTADIPDSVVNQRVMVTVWLSSRPDRTGKGGVGVWIDQEQADDQTVFRIGDDGWRGMDGEGLTPSEARYVAAALYQEARRLLAAAGIDAR